MQTKEYHNVDKSKWGGGEWQNEPDKKQWKDAVTGLPCLANRGPGGHWCGYVGVPPDHALHGKDYYAVDADVHGGLTFSDKCRGTETEGICHAPDPGESHDVWWFGFDCAHYTDLSPAYRAIAGFPRFNPHEVYRELSFVEMQCGRLAEQLWAMRAARQEDK